MPEMTIEKFMDRWYSGSVHYEPIEADLVALIKAEKMEMIRKIEKIMTTHPEDMLFYLIEIEKWQQFKAKIKGEV